MRSILGSGWLQQLTFLDRKRGDMAILCQDGFAHEQQWLAVKAEWRKNFNKLRQECNTIVVRFTDLNIPVGGSNSSDSWTEKGWFGHFVSRRLCPWTTMVSCQSQMKKLITNCIRNIVFTFTNLNIPVGGSNSSNSWTEKGRFGHFVSRRLCPWTTMVSCQSQIKKLIANYIRNMVVRFTNLNIPVGGSSSSNSWTGKGRFGHFVSRTTMIKLSKPNEEEILTNCIRNIVVRLANLNIPVGGSNNSNSWTGNSQFGHFVSRRLCPC